MKTLIRLDMLKNSRFNEFPLIIIHHLDPDTLLTFPHTGEVFRKLHQLISTVSKNNSQT